MYCLILYSWEVFFLSDRKELINFHLLGEFNFFPVAKFKKIFEEWFKSSVKVVFVLFLIGQ